MQVKLLAVSLGLLLLCLGGGVFFLRSMPLYGSFMEIEIGDGLSQWFLSRMRFPEELESDGSLEGIVPRSGQIRIWKSDIELSVRFEGPRFEGVGYATRTLFGGRRRAATYLPGRQVYEGR